MRQKNAASCSQILQDAALPMLERARKLERLNVLVHGLLPVDLGAHCKLLNVKNEILVLAADSPAWAARLRFVAPELCKQLRCQHALSVSRAEIRIQPQAVEPTQNKRHAMKISATNANLLAQTAQGVDHPGLKEALYRLAAITGIF